MRPWSVALAVLLVAPVAAVPGGDDAKTDGVPFELDAASIRDAVRAFAADASGARIYDCVNAITTNAPEQYRVMGTPTQKRFLQDHATVFSQLGLKSSLQAFAEGGPSLGTTVTTGGTNLLAVLPGRDLHKWIVIGSHYDTREATIGGGALDNASGMCTVLEIARAMKSASDRQPLQASVVFAWYDGEEWGLFGSIALAKDMSVPKQLLGLPADAPVRIVASQSFDMPGLNYPAKNNWVQYGNATDVDKTAVLNLRTAPIHAETDWACFSYGCYQDLKGRPDFKGILANNTDYQFLVREVAYDLLQLPKEFVWVYDDAYGRSDHVPLIARGAAGMRIQGSHDAEYPHYHQPTDSLPALEAQAGGKDLLIGGYDTEARVGGTVAYYAALTGSVGHYGYLFDASLAPAGNATSTTTPAENATPIPLPLAFAAVTIAVLLRRKP